MSKGIHVEHLKRIESLAEVVSWTDVSVELPDEDLIVLVHADVIDGEPVWFGYLDSGRWRYVDGGLIDNVTHWAEMLRGPSHA